MSEGSFVNPQVTNNTMAIPNSSAIVSTETARLLPAHHDRPGSTSSETSSIVSSSTSSSEEEEENSHHGQPRGYGTCAPLLSDEETNKPKQTAADTPPEQQGQQYSNAYIARVVISLLIGVFTSNADSSLVMATHPVIASEFDDLEDSSWLLISFMLAAVATQSIVSYRCGAEGHVRGEECLFLLMFGVCGPFSTENSAISMVARSSC